MAASRNRPRWRRSPFGWLRVDGEVFLERGGPMSDTGHPAWIVWVRAADGDVEVEGTCAWTKDGTNARALGELMGNDPKDVRPDGPWFVHVGDEGWLADAKVAAAYHVAQRDARAAARSA